MSRNSQSKKPVVGNGKSYLLKTKWCITPEIERIIREAKKIEEDDEIHSIAAEDWFASMTKEENAEYERLFQEHSKVEDEFFEKCPLINTEVTCKGDHCSICAKVRGKDGYILECTQECDIYRKNVEMDRKLADFNDSHGVHKCHECSYWGRDVQGKCSQFDRYVSGYAKACGDFYTETSEDTLIREKRGPYETEELRVQRLKWEAEHKDQIEAFKKDFRRKVARRYADGFSSSMEYTRGIYSTSAEYIEKMYAEFPEEFARCPYKTYGDLKAAVERK